MRFLNLRQNGRNGRFGNVLLPALAVVLLFTLGFAQLSPPAQQRPADLIREASHNLPVKADSDRPFSQNAWDYFHPSWIRSNRWTVIAISENLGDSIEASKAGLLIDDPRDRIEKEFIPQSDLRGRVQFWIDIYSRFSSRTRVIHDRRNPEIIYGYIDFRPLFRNMKSPAAAEIKAQRFERAILKELRSRLDEAAGLKKTKFLEAKERMALQSFLSRSGALNKSSYLRLIRNIRTQTGQSDVFLMALIRAKYLLPHIESVFKQQGLPVALARIPFVESSFNTRALSKIGAVGIWQFTPETARELIHAEASNLWSDPLRQTKSAAKLLRLYRSALPDWGTTITSYNSGVGRVKRLIKKYHLKNVTGLIELTKFDGLGFAGKNFYSEFLAANFVEAYKEELFGSLLYGTDSMLVFKRGGAVPEEKCDL